MRPTLPAIEIRNTTPEDFAGIIEVCRLVYPNAPAWRIDQLSSHIQVFPEGQFVATEQGSGRIVGMAASLVLLWADYKPEETWNDFTDTGMFTNHDPEGHTLYGAEVIVRPDVQRRGVGRKLYHARRELTVRLGLHRIRAAARLRGYHRYARRLPPEEYVAGVVRGEIRDPTLSFQIREGFEVLQVVYGYLKHDPESLGFAALIEWMNPAFAHLYADEKRDPRFRRPDTPPPPPGSTS